MTTRITSSGPGTGVAPTPTAPRVTPAPARPFKQVMSAGERAVVGGAEAAVTRLPGGPVLAAAFRSPGGSGGLGGAGGSATASAEGPTGTASDPGGSSAPSMDQVLSQSADQNLYYLQLQERISAENRAYTAVSNVLKARHDTVKNAISNIR